MVARQRTLGGVLHYFQSSHWNGSSRAYSRVLSQLRRVEAPVGTMGVTIREGAYTLLYDPSFVESEEVTLHQLSKVLIHEFLHLLLEHIPRYSRALRRAGPNRKPLVKQFANVAMDYAVNSLMVNLGEATLEDFKGMGRYSGVYPTDVGLPEGKSFEWYLRALLSNPEEFERKMAASSGGEGGEGQSLEELLRDYLDKVNCPIHEDVESELENLQAGAESDGEGDGMLSQIERGLVNKGKGAIREGLEGMKGKGALPGGLQTIVDEALAPPKLPWKGILRRFLESARDRTLVPSFRRPKRRIAVDEVDPQAEPCNFPGRTPLGCLHIVFGIDTSGSVSDAEIKDILTELRGVVGAYPKTSVTVIEADTRIQREYKLASHSDIPGRVAGRGGTDYEAVFSRAKEVEADLLIYATDGECGLPCPGNRLPPDQVLWMVTRGSVWPGTGYWGGGNKEKYGRAVFMQGARGR